MYVSSPPLPHRPVAGCLLNYYVFPCVQDYWCILSSQLPYGWTGTIGLNGLVRPGYNMISYISKNHYYCLFVCLFVLENTVKSDRNRNSSTRSRPCIKQVKACCVWLQPRCLEFLHPKGRAIIRSIRVGRELKPLWGMAKKGFIQLRFATAVSSRWAVVWLGWCGEGFSWGAALFSIPDCIRWKSMFC